MEFLGFSVNSAAWFFAGLVVGWNVLPQPAWVGNLYSKWFGTEE
jgi:hypothetical protein